MITLSISHNIYLSDDELSKLKNKETIKAIGVSVPVWFYKGTTSEPAKEVFCDYIISNIAEDYPVTNLDKGYKFNIPQEWNEELTFKRYNKVTENGKRFNVVHIIDIKNIKTLMDTLC